MALECWIGVRPGSSFPGFIGQGAEGAPEAEGSELLQGREWGGKGGREVEKSMAALWWGIELGVTSGMDPQSVGWIHNPQSASITPGMDP